MLKRILATAMATLVLILAIQLATQRLFTEKRLEAAEAMAPTEPAEQEPREDAPETESESASAAGRPEVYALFGVDTEQGDAGRSDCILLVSLEDGVLRMCSLARDTLVTLAGEDAQTKLGHAYAYGGPQTALRTINESFGLDVERYATVNFTQLAELVELVGGVEVQLSKAEWDYLGLEGPYLGKRRLSGQEALAYCRIRAIDNDDMRTKRQRTVAAAMLTSLRAMPRSKLPELAAAGLRLCRTNLGLGDLLHLGKLALDMPTEVVSLSIPGDAVPAWGGVREDGVWYYVYDLNRAAEAVNQFFYGAAAETVTAVE